MLKHLALAACVLVCGCAADVTHRLEPAADDAQGIRYYQNAPYLLVYSDGQGGLKWQILYLPDQSRIMTVNPTIRGGHTEMTLYFQNGVLASASSIGDTTEIPKAVIAAIQSALPLIAGAAFEGQKQPGFPAPYLYKIVATATELKFIGGKGDTNIDVPIKSGDAK